MVTRACSYSFSAALGLLFVLTACPAAHAVDIGYSLGYRGAYTNNARLEEGDGQDDLINNFNFGFDLEQQGAGLSAEIDSQFNYQQFTNDSANDVLRGDADLAAIWRIRPGSLEWHATDVFGSLAISDTQTENPNNRQNTNAFSTGPRFFFRAGARNTLQVDFRYENYTFETSDLDSDRVAGLFSFGRPLSETVEISFNVAGSTVTYDAETADDFDRVDVYWQGDVERSSGEFRLAIGASSIQSEGPEDPSGLTGRLDWSRSLAAGSTLSLNLSSEFTDTGSSLREGFFDRPDVGSVQVNAETFRRSNAELSYSRDSAQGGFTLLIYGTDINFESATTDQQILGASGSYRRTLTARASLNLGARYAETEFDQLNREDTDLRASLGLSYLLRQTLTLDVGGSWSDRDSSDPMSSYEEVRGELGITYAVPLR